MDQINGPFSILEILIVKKGQRVQWLKCVNKTKKDQETGLNESL